MDCFVLQDCRGIRPAPGIVLRGGQGGSRRGEQAREWMWSEVSETLLERLRADAGVRADLDSLEADVVAGRTSPAAAARVLLERFSG